MKEIVIGTANPAKTEMVRAVLEPVGVKVVSAGDLGVALHIEEDGQTPQDNARKKARTYARALGLPVLSIDNALYMEGLPLEEQPGIHVRRIPGREGRPSDQDLLDYYLDRVRGLGHAVNGQWEFAIAVACPDGRLYERTILSPRGFVSEPSRTLLAGYPLESIQVDPKTGQYISEMTDAERRVFWCRIVGDGLRELVLRVLTDGCL